MVDLQKQRDKFDFKILKFAEVIARAADVDMIIAYAWNIIEAQKQFDDLIKDYEKDIAG